MLLKRRDVLRLGVSAATASALAPATTGGSEIDSRSFRIIDTNVSLFRWPFRRLPLDEPSALVRKLRSLGIEQAWAGSFEGHMHRDLAGVNRRLAKVCSQYPELTAIGTVNPSLPDWETDLVRCRDEHRMPGIRLHPNYHGYPLDDPRFVRLMEQATAGGQFVQISTAVEDIRTQYFLLQVHDVDLAPLARILPGIPRARVQVLNCRPTAALLEKLAAVPGLSFDVARVEGTDGVPSLIQQLPPGRVMFGTHAPFLIPEASLIRVHESGQLGEEALRAVLALNAEQFAGKKA